MQHIYGRESTPPGVGARSLAAGLASSWQLCAILGGGLVLRLALLRVHGTQGDLTIFVRWAQWLMAYGTHGLYGHTDATVRTAVNYPPVYSLILSVVVWIYQLPALHEFHSDAFLRVLLKLPAIVADIGIALLAYVIVLPRGGRRPALAAAAIAAYMPSLWPVSAIWGQIDSVPAALMLGAIALTIARRYTFAWIVLALAVLVKPLPVVIAPLIVAAQLQDEGVTLRLAFGPFCGLVVAYLTSLPFAPSGAPLRTLEWLASTLWGGQSLYLVTSENAYNLWTLIANPMPDARTFAGITLHAWGWIAFFAVAIPAYIAYFRRSGAAGDPALRERLVVIASFIVLAALFLLATRMHERYILPALVLAPLMWRYGKAERLAPLVLTVTFILGVGVQELSGHLPAVVLEAAIRGLSLVNVACLVPLAIAFFKVKRDNRVPSAI